MKRKAFVRPQRDKPDLYTGVGEIYKLDTWLIKVYPQESTYLVDLDLENNEFVIGVEGDVILSDFDIVSGLGHSVRFGNVTGSITRLYVMSIENLYNKIKDYYYSVLDNCLGKPAEIHKQYLWGESGDNQNNVRGINYPELIKASEKYIRQLPYQSADMNLEDLVEQILSGDLEYAFHAKDKYSVEMHQYAKALKKLL